jgi:hypothetical protein
MDRQSSNFQQPYKNLSFDNDKEYRVASLKGLPWVFTNMLPYEIEVYMYRPAKTELIGVIQANGKLSTKTTSSGLDLKEGDAIHVLRRVNGKKYEILRAVFLFDDSREVKLGDIVFIDVLSTAGMIDIWHDIIGIRVHNHISMPVDVYYRNYKIGSIAGDDGTGFMAGSPNSVYLNNDRFGFEIGDELSFVFSHDQKPYAKVKIIDNFTSDIVLGQISQHFVPIIQDYYSYRVDRPNITGLRYYDQVTGYSSIGNDNPKHPAKPYSKVCAITQGVKL